VQDLRFILRVSRPRFWFYIFGPYLVGLVAGVATRNEIVDWRLLAYGLYFVLPANLLVYGVNDIFDYDTDKLNAKKTQYETLVGPQQARRLLGWIAALNLPFVAAAAVVFGVRSFIALLIFILLSLFYSAPPIRAKTKPFLDSAFNVLYILPGVFAYAIATGHFPPAQIIVAGGLWTAAMHAYSAIPDIRADSDAGLSTVATVLGEYGTLALCFVLYGASALLSLPYLGLTAWFIGAAYLGLMLVSVTSIRAGQIFKLYRAFPLVNVAAGFVIFWQIALDKLV